MVELLGSETETLLVEHFVNCGDCPLIKLWFELGFKWHHRCAVSVQSRVLISMSVSVAKIIRLSKTTFLLSGEASNDKGHGSRGACQGSIIAALGTKKLVGDRKGSFLLCRPFLASRE